MMTSRRKSFREMKFSHLLNGDFKPAIVMSYRKKTGVRYSFMILSSNSTSRTNLDYLICALPGSPAMGGAVEFYMNTAIGGNLLARS